MFASSSLEEIYHYVYYQLTSVALTMLDDVNGLSINFFSNEFIQAIVNFFTLFAWGLGLTGAAIAIMDFAVSYQTGGGGSFTGTDLAAALRATGRKHVIIVGFMTHMCVSTTARATLDQGFPCTLVANGCATRDLPDGMGGVIPAQTVHTVELAALADRFAEVVCDTDDILD